MAPHWLRMLLALWCVLVIAPAVIATVVGGLGANDDVGGGTILVWVIGYLVQFAVFMLIARRRRVGSSVAWIIPSLLPWIAAWTAPVSLWWLAPCTAVAVAFAVWIGRRVARDDRLAHHGIPARAVVLEVRTPLMNVVVNNAYIKRTLRLRIERGDGAPPYETKYRGTFMIGDIPSVGDTLALRVDPGRPHHVEMSGAM